MENNFVYNEKTNSLIINNKIPKNIENFTCRDTRNGKCFYNKSLEYCAKNNLYSSLYISKGKKSVCFNFDKEENVDPTNNLIDNKYEGFKVVSILKLKNDEFKDFPTNISNVVFYNDLLTMRNIENGTTLGKVDIKEEMNSMVIFDNLIDVNLVPISKNIQLKDTNTKPILYGDKMNFLAKNTILIFSREENEVVWKTIGKDNFNITLKNLNGKREGEVVYYTDTFEIFVDNNKIFLNNNEMSFVEKEDSVSGFGFLQKSFGWYCNENKELDKVHLSLTQNLGEKLYYKGNNVFRSGDYPQICRKVIKIKNIEKIVEEDEGKGWMYVGIIVGIFVVLLIILNFLYCIIKTNRINNI